MLQNVENKTEFKHISEDSIIQDSLPRLGRVELDSGVCLDVRDGMEVLIQKSARKDVMSTLHLTHLATNSMMLQTKSRLFWPGIRADLESS